MEKEHSLSREGGNFKQESSPIKQESSPIKQRLPHPTVFETIEEPQISTPKSIKKEKYLDTLFSKEWITKYFSETLSKK